MTAPDIAYDGLDFRPANIVMDIDRLGTLYPYPLSFMRSLIRRIARDAWDIQRTEVELDVHGCGHVIYAVQTATQRYSYVIFAKYLDPDMKSDRVIANDWDMTVTLCEGDVGPERLARLRANVPLQENGRVDSRCFVLSRANKSNRNFDYVVDRLSQGLQPDLDVMAKVGYLYRTTAVYGSGKFGMADWAKVRDHYPDFAYPFAAEMFSCFLIRDFSLFQADYVAQMRNPETAVRIDDTVKRYVGIGNATGLGMAPYLINHPLLINNWIEVRETAIALVKRDGAVTQETRAGFQKLAQKAVQHLDEISTDNADQNAINARARSQIVVLADWIDGLDTFESWTVVTDHAQSNHSHEVQELLHALLLELFADLVYPLEDQLNIEERYDLVPEMRLETLMAMIRERYGWALDFDFSQESCTQTVWYRSEEKQEPRLGGPVDPIAPEQHMLMGIARCVRDCFDDLTDNDGALSTARFVLAHPRHRYIIRRIQTMAQTRYGDIQANVLDKDVLPINLLRCKLSFFGVGKFDPRSRLWVRNTMFQGAPLLSDLAQSNVDDWCFPTKPCFDGRH